MKGYTMKTQEEITREEITREEIEKGTLQFSLPSWYKTSGTHEFTTVIDIQLNNSVVGAVELSAQETMLLAQRLLDHVRNNAI